MWRIRDMKERGWSWVRTMFGPAYLACLISFALNGLGNRQLNPLLSAGTANSWMDRLQMVGPVQMFFLPLLHQRYQSHLFRGPCPEGRQQLQQGSWQ